MQSVSSIKRNLFQNFSYFLKAFWIFFPGVIFIGLGYFAFCSLSQGKDLIYQSTDNKLTGVFLVLAAMYWVFTSWYTARLVAYNRNDLFKVAKWPLYHMPRLIAYLVFWVLWLAIYFVDDIDQSRGLFIILSFFVEMAIYILIHWLLDLKPDENPTDSKLKTLKKLRWVARGLIVMAVLVTIFLWGKGNINVMLVSLPIIQFCLLYLLVVRRPLSKTLGAPGRFSLRNIRQYDGWINRYLRWTLLDTVENEKGENTAGGKEENSETIAWEYERPVFIIYHILAICAVLVYGLAIFSLPLARFITAFPLAILGFGILLGAANFVTLFSRRKQINFHFLIILIVIGAGLLHDPHKVTLAKGANNYKERPTLKEFTQNWLSLHEEEISKATPENPYPVFFVLADGGASRSGYWAAGVLDLLHDSTLIPGTSTSLFQQHLFCLSGASGGSVGNGSFVAQLAAEGKDSVYQKQPLSRNFLRNDFLSFTLVRLLGFDIFSGLSPFKDRAFTLENSLEHPKDVKGSEGIMAKLMQGDIGRMIPGQGNQLPALIINTTRVQDGSPAVVSTIRPDSVSGLFEKRTDVLGLVNPGQFMRLSTAVILGARFPYMSPGGYIKSGGQYHYFVDGGYFDNSGAGAVHEMIQALEKMAKDSTDKPFAEKLKKLRYYVIHVANSPYESSEYKSIAPLVNNLATPLLTLAGSYGSQTSVNDDRLKNYLGEMSNKQGNYASFNLYRSDTVESFPMNWVISKKRLKLMDQRIHMDSSAQLQLAWNIRNYHKIMDAEPVSVPGHRTESKFVEPVVEMMGNIPEKNAPDQKILLDTLSKKATGDSIYIEGKLIPSKLYRKGIEELKKGNDFPD